LPVTERRSSGLPAGLGVEGDALGFAGAGEQRIASGEVGEGGERGVLVELFEDELLRVGADAAAAGEDGLAARRQAFDEGEELVAFGLGEGFEIVENEQRLRGAERVEQEPDALVLRGPGEVGLPELAGEFIEHLQKPGTRRLPSGCSPSSSMSRSFRETKTMRWKRPGGQS
jgi:hypothetical protein